MELSLNVYHNLTSLETANARNAISKKRYKDNLQMKWKKNRWSRTSSASLHHFLNCRTNSLHFRGSMHVALQTIMATVFTLSYIYSYPLHQRLFPALGRLFCVPVAILYQTMSKKNWCTWGIAYITFLNLLAQINVCSHAIVRIKWRCKFLVGIVELLALDRHDSSNEGGQLPLTPISMPHWTGFAAECPLLKFLGCPCGTYCHRPNKSMKLPRVYSRQIPLPSIDL